MSRPEFSCHFLVWLQLIPEGSGDSDKVEYGISKRIINVEIETPSGLPPAEGIIQLRYQMEKTRKAKSWESTDIWVDISEGKGQAIIPTPSYITHLSTKDIKGYWIEPRHGIKSSTNLVQTSAEPLTYSVKATAAGGIWGNVNGANGQPVESFETLMIHQNWPKNISHFWSLISSQRHSESFAVTTIPLNEMVALLVNNGSEWICTEPFVLTKENAILNLELNFSPSKPIAGQILNPDGSPAIDVDVQILNTIDIAEGFSTYSYSSRIRTDINGYFCFEKVTIDPNFKYKLNISGHGEYKRQTISVEPGSTNTYTRIPIK